MRVLGCPSVLLLLTVVSTTGCARSAQFSVPNAERHVTTLANHIGVRVSGTDGARRARAYLVTELARYGFTVHVQEALTSRPESGLSAKVANIIGVKDGSRREAVALVSHYDSPPESRGAADAAMGVAVLVEAGRILALRDKPRWTLVVAMTDAEEYGLLGATALVRDPVWSRVKAYLNFEAVGSGPPVLLFETGPGNGWLTAAWARHAPMPAGTSVNTEIYKRLPNDTDFTILARTGVPGLNFASVGDSYAYHTSRDVPERLSARVLSQAGENAVAIVDGLESVDITNRTQEQADYVAITGLGAFILPSANRTAPIVALLALVAWFLLGRRLLREVGLAAALLAALWAVVGVAAAVGTMVGVAASLRAAASTLNPWYAHPWRTYITLALAAATGGWIVARLRAVVPRAVRRNGHPLASWVVTLPVWILLALAAWRYLPSASYLATLPLGSAAALALCAAVLGLRPAVLRVAAVLVLSATSWIWFDLVATMFDIIAPIFGRMGIVAPLLAWPAMITILGFWVGPWIVAAAGGLARSRRAIGWVTVALLLATGASWIWANRAPAYTDDRPQYRSARYVRDTSTSLAIVEVGGSERDAPPPVPRAVGPAAEWQLVTAAPDTSVPVGGPGAGFVYRANVDPVDPPFNVSASERAEQDAVSIEVTVVPTRPLFAAALILPPGITPIESSLPGVVSRGRWRMALAAPPTAGVVFRVKVPGAARASLDAVRVVATVAGLPGGAGWQGLPAWLPAKSSTWTARSTFIVPLPITF